MNQDVMKALSLIGVVVVLFVVVQSGSLTGTQATQSGSVVSEPSTPLTPKEQKNLVLDICSACHGLSDLDGTELVAGRGVEDGFKLFEGVSMIMTPREWTTTVSRMRVANSCAMEDFEETIIIEWLNENY